MPSAAPSTSPGRPLGAFLAIARTEVARYGDDDDIFVRELVQNARDAGATAIRFKSRSEGDHDVIGIDDDGHGMSRATVERALLRLFSSEKDHSVAAGCFGVGFWSVLRFADHSIVVDTHDGNVGTALVIDLEREELRELSSSRRRPGTTITLRRKRGAPVDVAAAVLRHAAFVTGIKGPPPRLVVDDGVTTAVLNRPLALDDDVLVKRAIAGDGFRGIVGLSQRPRVEFLHHGLRVVEASSLASIVPSQKRTRRAGLGLSARVDIDGLSVLIDRKTVVEDARVRAVVRACEDAAHALEREALDDAAPLPLLAHAWRMVAALPWRAALIAVLTLAVGAGIGVLGLWVVRPELRPTTTSLVRDVGVPALLPVAPPAARALASARAGFSSPRIDVRGSSGGWDVDVRGVGTGLLRLFVLSEPDRLAGLRAGPSGGRAPAPTGPPGDGPLVALRVDAAGTVALPLLTGARVVRVVDARQPTKPLPHFVDADGLPVVDVAGPAVLHVEEKFLAAVADTPRGRRRSLGNEPALAPLIDGVGAIDDEAAIDAIVAAVQGRVAYAADADAASAFDDDNRPFLEKTLAQGRGDCDVINTVLVRALLAAGFEAHLAVGLVVVDDAVADDLHAWAEVRTLHGYQTLDASPPEARPRPSSAPARATAQPRHPQPRSPPATTAPRTTTTTATTVALGLLAVCGVALAIAVLRARAARRGVVVPLDVLPLFVAGLASGAGERLGLRRRPFLPSLAHGPLAIDDVVALAHRGRVVRGTATPTWLHRSVRVLVADDPRVRALLPHLPALLDVDAFDFDDDDDDLVDADLVDADLAAVRAVVDARLRGVLLVRANVGVVDEAFVRTARGHSHIVRVPRVLADDALRTQLVAAATTLREVRAALTRGRPR